MLQTIGTRAIRMASSLDTGLLEFWFMEGRRRFNLQYREQASNDTENDGWNIIDEAEEGNLLGKILMNGQQLCVSVG